MWGERDGTDLWVSTRNMSPWEGTWHEAAFSSNKKIKSEFQGAHDSDDSLSPLMTEQVSTPEIKVLNWTLENGNCSLMLACTVEKGDHMVYGWSTEVDTHPLSAANGSHLLHLTLGPQHADDIYTCTASNPISNRSQTFIPWSSCSSYAPGEWWLVCHLNAMGSVPPGPITLLLQPRPLPG